ncbi:MAG: tetratricopeptide repeat protein [Pyrinomonadaceae bacterium]
MIKQFPTLRTIVCAVLFLAACISLSAQTEEEVAQATVKAMALIEQQRFAEALPHLEIVVKAIPDDAKIRFFYGWSLIAKSKQVDNLDEAKQLSAKALEQLKEAKKLGMNEPELDSLLALMSGEAPAGSGGPAYSLNAEAEKLMHKAEGLFVQSNYAEAAKLFEQVLAIDPKVYQAAVSGGDCFVQSGDWAIAEKWYQRAITIDPTRETAYRYSATPLMKQKKYDEARERYIEAFIVEPYNRMSHRGINQWSDVTGKSLRHPDVEIPEFTFDAKGKAAPKSAIDPKDPSMSPWLAYLATRETWKNERFVKTFAKEKQYRHSLAEEADALRAAIKAAQTGKSSNKQFETLGQLDKEGLLEAFILLARPDEGIAEDHPEYLKNNRPKLRLYVANYVIQK